MDKITEVVYGSDNSVVLIHIQHSDWSIFGLLLSFS